MKLPAIAATAIAALLVASAAEAGPKVVTTIKPVHSLVAGVMAGIGEPSLIVDGAGSPHTYSLKPSQARAVEQADMVVWIGHELEAFLEKLIETLGANARVLELAETDGLVRLKLREGGAFEGHGHEETAEADDGHGHDEFDMHLWLDPRNAAVMTRRIAEALAETDPANAERYRANGEATIGRLDELTAELDDMLAPVRNRPFVVFHDAYHYFENRFGLSAAGSITVSPDVMPGAERIAALRAKVRETGAACAFSEPQFEPKLVAVVTEGTDARAGVLDPLGADIEPGGELYFELMRRLAASVRDCLAEAS